MLLSINKICLFSTSSLPYPLTDVGEMWEKCGRTVDLPGSRRIAWRTYIFFVLDQLPKCSCALIGYCGFNCLIRNQSNKLSICFVQPLAA